MLSATSKNHSATQRDKHSAARYDDRGSASFEMTRDTLLRAGLPFVYLQTDTGVEKAQFEPVDRFFPDGFRGAPTKTNARLEFARSRDLLADQRPVFLQTPMNRQPKCLGTLGSLAQLHPGTDIFLNSLLQWPRGIESTANDYEVIYTSALFQAGIFVPQDKQYATMLLDQVFPKFSRTYLPAALSEALEMAVMEHEHPCLVAALIDLGADPNRLTADGNVPLNEALWRTNMEAVDILLDRGAKNKADVSGVTVLDLLYEEFDPAADKSIFSHFEKLIEMERRAEAVDTSTSGV